MLDLLLRMKPFISIIILTALASAEYKLKSDEEFSKYYEECIEHLKIPADHQTSNESSPCFIKCLMEKIGLFDKDTGYSVDKVHKQLLANLDQGKYRFRTTKCTTNTQGSSVCEWEYRECPYSSIVNFHKDSDEIRAKIEKCVDKNPQGTSVCEWAYRGHVCVSSITADLIKFISDNVTSLRKNSTCPGL